MGALVGFVVIWRVVSLKGRGQKECSITNMHTSLSCGRVDCVISLQDQLLGAGGLECPVCVS